MSYLVKSNIQVDYILLDGSASMSDKWEDSLRAIQTYVSVLKAEHIPSHIYLHIFTTGDQLDLCGFDGPINEWESCMGLTLPFAGTPLYDAINLTGQRMRAWDPPKAHVTIVTDGGESDSKFTDLTQAKAIIQWMKAKGWPVTFIGADFSNFELAAALGSGKQEAIGVQKKLLSDAARNLAKKRAAHARGQTEGIGFSEDEQQQFGGYLAPPKG